MQEGPLQDQAVREVARPWRQDVEWRERFQRRTDRLEGLENEAICEETHKSMKELMEEVKTTTVNFEQTVEAAAQAVVEAEKDKETKG